MPHPHNYSYELPKGYHLVKDREERFGLVVDDLEQQVAGLNADKKALRQDNEELKGENQVYRKMVDKLRIRDNERGREIENLIFDVTKVKSDLATEKYRVVQLQKELEEANEYIDDLMQGNP